MMSLWQGCWFSLGIGWLTGVICAWKEKVMFVIWTLAFITIIIGSFAEPTQTLSNLYGSWWKFIIRMLFVGIGFYSGKFTYKEIFEKEQN